MKIENGDFVPSPQLISQIAKALPKEWQDELVKSYSRSQFPDFAYLFPSERPTRPESTPLQKTAVLDGSTRELTKRQVAILVKSISHYHLFLVLTMARRPLQRKELEKKFKRIPFEKTLADLDDGKFLLMTGETVQLQTTEWRFPSSADDNTLIKSYEQFDEWDLQFGEQFGFETLLQKMLIRRISPRYLGLIQKQLEICLDLVRTSDELETKHNESLVQIRVQLKSGVLPG
ncbi:MAG: hypothetical protein ACK5P7_05090 [Bdellovibrio sp.]